MNSGYSGRNRPIGTSVTIIFPLKAVLFMVLYIVAEIEFGTP